jgi:dihydroceramidase
MWALPITVRVFFFLWLVAMILLVFLLLEEQSGVAVHQSRTKIGRIGYWGSPTANIDWCEDNYAVSPYVAEFWNAMSSLSFLVTSAVGVYLTLKYELESRFLICFGSIFIMGFGSVMFHSTLLRSTQILDEIPMVLSGLTFMYIIRCMKDQELDEEKRKAQQKNLGIFLTAIGTLFTAIYLLLPENPTFVQAAFVSVVCYITVESFRMHSQCEDHPEARAVIELAGLSFVTGSLLWLIEPRVCFYVGWLNLHAWWHLLVCYGVYLCVVFYKYIRLTALGKRPSFVKLERSALLPVTCCPNGEA